MLIINQLGNNKNVIQKKKLLSIVIITGKKTPAYIIKN